jgi:aerobic carbon-monoxide dehydrogenase medium subunit
LEALAEASPPRILAGGQSLVPMLNLRLAPADAILDITRVPELRETHVLPTSIRYGALTTHAAFEDLKVPDGSNGLLSFVGGQIAYRAVRTRGTIGGALALADPAADWVTAVTALEGTMHLASKGGRRAIAAQDFILGPYFTALQEGELIESVEIPKRQPTERWGYYKVVTKVGEYANSMAITLLDRERRFARVVLGATDGAPLVLASTARAILEGRSDADLRDQVPAELRAGGQSFSPAQFILHTTTVLRSIRDAAAK